MLLATQRVRRTERSPLSVARCVSGSEAYSVITRERRVWTRATPCSSVPCADETNVCEADMAAVVRRVVYCAAGSRHVHAD